MSEYCPLPINPPLELCEYGWACDCESLDTEEEDYESH